MQTHPKAFEAQVSSFPQLDLTTLERGCFLRSKVRRETYDGIASELCDYGLTWGTGPIDARAYRMRAGAISAYKILYGSEVTIEPDLYKNFMLVHLCLKKGIEVETDGKLFRVLEGEIFLCAPRSSIKLRWEQGCEQLLVRVPLDLLRSDTRARVLCSGRLLAREYTSLLIAQLNLAMSLSENGDMAPNQGSWLEYLERNIGTLIALHLSETKIQDLPRSNSFVTSSSPRGRKDRLVSYIEERFNSPIELSDLISLTGLSRTQLNSFCQEAFECSPMSLVRRLRLKAARADLLRNPSQNLIAVTLRYGFEHQSRFAQYYRSEFGELPSETKRSLLEQP
jgi:AraC-like DNA-binding protein